MDRKEARRKYLEDWESFSGFADPIKTWEWLNQAPLLTAEEKRFAGLSPLIGPAMFLSKIGTPEEIEAEARKVYDAIDVLKKHLGDFVKRDLEELSFLASAIKGRVKAARIATEYLSRNGWHLDPITRKIKAKAKHKGRDFLSLCIQTLGVEYGTDPHGREKIKEHLSAIFDAELDAGPRGNIARALENLKR